MSGKGANASVIQRVEGSTKLANYVAYVWLPGIQAAAKLTLGCGAAPEAEL